MSGRRQKPDAFTGDLFAGMDAAREASETPARDDASPRVNTDATGDARPPGATPAAFDAVIAPAIPVRIDTPQRMLDVLERWVERGWLRSLDAGFARFLAFEARDAQETRAPHDAPHDAPQASPLLLLAAALASHQLGRGHVCLDLQTTLDDPTFALSLPPEEPNAWARRDITESRALPPTPAEVLSGVTLAQWHVALSGSTAVAGDADSAGSTPLVLIGTRLYLRRYWQYEQDVRAGIATRLATSAHLQAGLPVEAVHRTLDVLFPQSATVNGNTGSRVDWQKLACALAARSGFSIVTGGPGTGKTTTVVRLLALLQALALHAPRDGSPATPDASQAANAPRPLRIRLAAPTGKAAARLNESIAGAVARLPVGALPDGEAVRDAIPTVVTTLHRVLGTLPDTRRFRHDAGNPLPVDVLVIDEASMVDLEMMAAVLAALPPSARLILLGDKDQLASVEAGAVIGELCARAAGGHYTPQTAAWLEAATGERIDPAMLDPDGTALDQAIAMLRHSHRFASDSGIGLLASLVNAGDADAVDRIWSDAHADLALVRCSAGDDAAFRALVVDGGDVSHATAPERANGRRGYRHYLDVMRAQRPLAGDPDAWALAVLDAHDAFQLLCALRRGPWGVEGLNRRIARLLQDEGLIDVRGEWYAGRPVLVTRNDYELGLMNGDIGIALELPGGALRVAFPAADGTGGVKWVLPSRLQAVETVFALTVHKSQGSEFVHAALVLPESFSPVMTRELVYTGITRARQFLSLAVVDGSDTLRLAVGAKVRRASGLGVGT